MGDWTTLERVTFTALDTNVGSPSGVSVTPAGFLAVNEDPLGVGSSIFTTSADPGVVTFGLPAHLVLELALSRPAMGADRTRHCDDPMARILRRGVRRVVRSGTRPQVEPDLTAYGQYPNGNPYQLTPLERFGATAAPLLAGIGVGIAVVATGGWALPALGFATAAGGLTAGGTLFVGISSGLAGGAATMGVSSYAAGGSAAEIPQAAVIGGIAGAVGGALPAWLPARRLLGPARRASAWRRAMPSGRRRPGPSARPRGLSARV